MRAEKAQKIDPLYVIFEQHLFNFQDSDSDRKTFIGNIVDDYLRYLRTHNVTVPKSLEQPVIEELFNQVNTMLVKKIYGCVSLDEYVQSHVRKAPRATRQRVRKRYTSLKDQAAQKTKAPKPGKPDAA